jgi:2-furoyl-CoA dehydrogenase large subunit
VTASGAGTIDLLQDRVTIACDRDRIWAIVDDPDPTTLARVLPGCEALERAADGSLRGTLAASLGFITIRADVTARFADPDPPSSVRLELEGRPRAIAGAFRASIPFELEAFPGGGTVASYHVRLAVSGRLAAFGAPLLRDTMRRQVATLAANLGRECVSRVGAGRPASA